MPTATLPRPVLVRAHAWSSVLLVVLVLGQAVLAGHALFGSASIEVHGYLGNASFVVGFALAALAGLARLPRASLTLSAVLLVALFCQVGLGYVGRESLAAAAWHVPLGVTIFGLATVQATLAFSGGARAR